MRQQSDTTEAPPAYVWETREVLSFCVLATFLGLFLLGAILYLPGFTTLLLGLFAVGLALYWWPQAFRRYAEWSELREFKKTIPEGMDEK